MRFLSSTLAFAFCFLGLSSAQNIYDGCGVDKECLGYEPDNPAENACLEAQVILALDFSHASVKSPEHYILTGMHCEVDTSMNF